MLFHTHDGIPFDIPDEWWAFAEMDTFRRSSARCFSFEPKDGVQLVEMAKVQTPVRDAGVEAFKKCKLVPILCALQAKNLLPPIKVTDQGVPPGCQYRVYDGFHRYYASVAVGFPMLPVIDINSQLRAEVEL